MVMFIKNDILQVWDTKTDANESKWLYYILSF